MATGIYLPGSRITEERERESQLREDLDPGREDRTLKKGVGAGAIEDRAKRGPRLSKYIRAGERARRPLAVSC